MKVIIFSATFILAWLVPLDASPLPGNTTALSSYGKCSNKALLDSITDIVNKASPGLQHLGDIPVYAATSCQQIASLRPQAQDGHYWIQEESGPARVYCMFGGGPCGEGVWMQVANVNMTQASSSCPAGLEKVTVPDSLCRKRVDSGCSSAKFSTHGVPFTKVCGRVIGIQYFSPQAFDPYFDHQDRTIDDLYVEGVSITHSSQPRQHIWTFAAALHEVPRDTNNACPCTNNKSHVPFTGLIPEFIGSDYFCETGSHTTRTDRYYVEDPLWDGQGCGLFSSCCEGEGKPWFHKTLPQPVSSDIEVRVCAENSRTNDEDVLIKILSLYIQ